jgi:hypothetical protein
LHGGVEGVLLQQGQLQVGGGQPPQFQLAPILQVLNRIKSTEYNT